MEEESSPVRVICVLQKSDAPEDEIDPRRGDLYHSIVIGLEVVNENTPCLAISQGMNDIFRAWRNGDLMRQDMDLAKKLTLAVGYGDLRKLSIHMISSCL